MIGPVSDKKGMTKRQIYNKTERQEKEETKQNNASQELQKLPTQTHSTGAMTALRIASTAEVFFSGSVSLLKVYISLITFNVLEHSGWNTSEIGQIQWFGMH